jgi:hypothetical protein
MVEFSRHRATKKVMKQLNQCRLYAQAMTLADVTTGDGRSISQIALEGEPDIDRKSHYIWPNQGRPTRKRYGNYGLSIGSKYVRGSYYNHLKRGKQR